MTGLGQVGNGGYLRRQIAGTDEAGLLEPFYSFKHDLEPALRLQVPERVIMPKRGVYWAGRSRLDRRFFHRDAKLLRHLLGPSNGRPDARFIQMIRADLR